MRARASAEKVKLARRARGRGVAAPGVAPLAFAASAAASAAAARRAAAAARFLSSARSAVAFLCAVSFASICEGRQERV